MKITDITVRALKTPARGAQIYYDDTLPGFGVRVSEGGTKSYVLTHGPRRKRETIGRVYIVTLKAARGRAKELLAQYTLGQHQSAAKPWDAAVKEYLEEIEKKRRAQTYKSYKRHLKKHFKFGDTRMNDISPHELEDIFKRLKDRPSELHHAFVNLRAFIRWAYRKSYLDKNPMERMQAPPSSKPKERVLTDAELKKVWNAAPDDPFGRIVKLLIICGQRLGETSSIETEMIRKDTITFPDTLTKNGRPHTFPFPDMARPYLHHLSYSGFSKAKDRLDRESGVSDWTLHDLRRTLRTKWAELGISREIAEKYINHVSGSHSGVEAVYNRHTYLPEMRAAVKLWDSYLQKLFKD